METYATHTIFTWDYNGHKSNKMFFGTQADWNKTILTQFDYIKGKLWQEGLIHHSVPVNVIIPRRLQGFINTLKEFNLKTGLLHEFFKITFISNVHTTNIGFLNGYEIEVLNYPEQLAEIKEDAQNEPTNILDLKTEIKNYFRANDKKLDEIISLIKNKGRHPFMGPL